MSGAPDRPIPERKAVKTALRDLGMTSRQVDALLRDGWKTLVGETEAENAELREQLAQLRQKLS
jgi:DNA-binding transcriptional MerR regulator